jgi:DNA-binding winged helix-turn-helix (wHTH) protein/Tol biopolymer transport system component
MKNQYWINGFCIDISRNQIMRGEETQTLAPKALAVLSYLAENQGKVVSYDDLLTQVWPDIVVNPNTLHRCIAQLRKAFRENNNSPSFIKTHAKQGYSLDCVVNWSNTIEDNKITVVDDSSANNEVNHTLHDPKKPYKFNNTISKSNVLNNKMAWFIAVIVLVAFGYYSVALNKVPLTIKKVQAITATNVKEFSGHYSPDGQFIVFNRYPDVLCMNHIWAKNTNTLEEFKLTKQIGTYGNSRFSPDGQTLIVIEQNDCNKPVEQNQCYQLVSLDFKKALHTPQSLERILECKNSEINRPTWLNNNAFALLQKDRIRWKLVAYSPKTQTSQLLYEVQEGNLIFYDYSSLYDLIAVTSINEKDELFLTMLKPSGEIISSNQIQLTEHISKFQLIYPRFTPFEQQLIFSTGRRLFSLSYDGEINKIDVTLDRPMGPYVFNTEKNTMLMGSGYYDSDVVSIKPSGIKQSHNKEHTHNFKIIARSNKGEYNGLVQPQGKLIALKSNRSGIDQIWLAGVDQDRAKMLTQFPMDTRISDIIWARDGRSLLANVDNVLTRVELNGSSFTYRLPQPIVRLFSWQSDLNTVLVSVRNNGVSRLATLNLATKQVHIVNKKKINWAQQNAFGQLVYTDHMDRFWLSGSLEDTLIEELAQQGSDKQFILKNNIIYGVNKQNQLWSYSLKTRAFNVMANLPDNIDYVTDFDGTQFIFSIRKEAKKEIMEVTFD